jgi:hypothetical protein
MLGIRHSDRRQFRDLMTPGPRARNPLRVGELVPAAAALSGVVIHDLIDVLDREKLTPNPTMTGLAARLASLRVLGKLLGFLARQRAPLLTRLRNVAGRRLRTVTRTRRPPCLYTPKPILERPQPTSEIKQNLNNPLAPRLINRLGLRPLHTATFPATPGNPAPTQTTERLPKTLP